MFAVALKDLLRRPARLAFTCGGVGLSVATFMAVFASLRAYTGQFQVLSTLLGTSLLVQQAGAPSPFSSFLDPQVTAQLKGLAHVQGVHPAVLTRVRAFGSMPVIVAGFETQGFLAGRVPLMAGRLPQPGSHELMVGEAMAERLKLRLGEVLTLRGLEFTVVAVYRTAVGMLNAGGLTDLLSAQELGNYRDALSFVLLDVEPGNEASVMSEVHQTLKGLEAMDSREYMGTLGVSRITSAFVSILGFVVVLMAALGVANTMQSSLNERKSELAMLRALGWSPWKVAQLVMAEVVFLAFVGVLVGFLGAVGALTLVATFGQEALRTTGVLAKTVPLGTVAIGGVLGFAACFFGALPPLWRTLRIPPWEGLHSL